MTEQRIENKLKSGFEKITPNVLDAVMKDVREEAAAQVMEASETSQAVSAGQAAPDRQDISADQIISLESRRKKTSALRFAGLAAALVLLVGGFLGFRAWQINNRVASVISLDVNPSVEIRTNEKEKVLEVIPLNEDGRTIVGEMDFAGSSLDVAVNALVGSMLRNGYLSELANSILISIDNNDPAAAAALEQKLMALVDGLLGDAQLEGAVLGQVVHEDADAQNIAAKYSISVGKARLIEVLMTMEPRYTAEELSCLSINELNNLYSAHKKTDGTEEKDPIDSIGKASTRAYIGADAAIETALKDAGIDSGAAGIECELDWEDGRMVYEVEFEAGGFEYEYGIDARTGEIVSAEKETAYDDHDDDPDAEPESQSSSGPEEEGSSASGETSVLISEEKARQIALAKAGVSADKIQDFSIKKDVEDGRTIYEVEFRSGGHEYEITIDAVTGEILEYECETED